MAHATPDRRLRRTRIFNIGKSPFNYFTVEEVNLICMYSKDNRQRAIDGLYHALAEVRDLDMVAMICRTLDKLQLMSNTEFEAIEFVEEFSY